MSGLFTVLIAEKEHINAIQQGNKLFFEPFLENKDLAFCAWDPAGQNLRDSVPGLLDAVGCHKEWRAVIINNVTMQSSKVQNPFDTVDQSRISALQIPSRQQAENETPEDWERRWNEYYEALAAAKEAVYKSALEKPFQKLATWLCFRPEEYVLNDVQEKQDVHDWAMEMLGRDDLKLSAKLELMERKHYKYEQRLKQNLRRSFAAEEYLTIAYPMEVHCISLRSAENNYFDPDAYWTIRQDTEYSEFADRNMYFDRMRFMVFDLLPPTHRNFRAEYIRFLATVLIFISNATPGSAMQARKLYRLGVETDDAPLCTLVTSYDRKLAATAEVIDSEMERIRGEIPGKLTDKAAEAMFCKPQDVTVVLDDSCDFDKVYAEHDYGLFFDQPEDEFHKWNRDYRESEKAIAYIAKQQSRSVRKSVIQMHQTSEVSDVNISRLTPLQIDDVREYTDAAEDEMVASIPPNLTDSSAYMERLAQESARVKKIIGRRMTKKTAVSIIAICLGLYFLCFLPFLLSNGGTSETITTAIILSIAMVGVLAIVMLVSLVYLRSAIVNAARTYNSAVRSVLDDIQTAMKQFSKYLSAFCNVRRGHSIQNYAKENIDVYTKGLRIRKKHLEDIRKRRAYLAEEYRDFLRDRSFCDETMSRPYEYDFDQMTEFAYPAPFLAGDSRQIEFISRGNLVTVPSSYVTRILVTMEGIYEK